MSSEAALFARVYENSYEARFEILLSLRHENLERIYFKEL